MPLGRGGVTLLPVTLQGSLESAVPQRLLTALRRICTREVSGVASLRSQYLRPGGALMARHTAEAPPPPPPSQQPPQRGAQAAQPSASGSAPAAGSAIVPTSPPAAASTSGGRTGGFSRMSGSLSRGGFEAALSRITGPDRLDQLQVHGPSPPALH